MKTFCVDENGIIITEVSSEKVTSHYKQIVDSILRSILQNLASEIDGVYLYGSVATGKAVRGKSDLDILIILKQSPDKQLSDKISALEQRLSEGYKDSLREVGFAISYVAEATSEKENFGLMCFMKHLCICIYGNDLTKDVGGFKPTKEVAKGFNSDIAKGLESSKTKLENATSEAEILRLSQQVSKRIIRTGFSLVMPRLQSWTTNLETSVDSFIKFYPERATQMQIALEWSKEGSEDKESVIEFINTFGLWLTKEFEREILTDQ